MWEENREYARLIHDSMPKKDVGNPESLGGFFLMVLIAGGLVGMMWLPFLIK